MWWKGYNSIVRISWNESKICSNQPTKKAAKFGPSITSNLCPMDLTCHVLKRYIYSLMWSSDADHSCKEVPQHHYVEGLCKMDLWKHWALLSTNNCVSQAVSVGCFCVKRKPPVARTSRNRATTCVYMHAIRMLPCCNKLAFCYSSILC